MGGGGDRLGRAELGSHAPEELSEVTLRPADVVDSVSYHFCGFGRSALCFNFYRSISRKTGALVETGQTPDSSTNAESTWESVSAWPC